MLALKIIALVAVAAVGVGLLAVVGANRAWTRGTASLEARIGAAEAVGPLPLQTPPEVVRRYLARALPATGEEILQASFVQEGHFQMGEGEEGWRPFRARETLRVQTPAFYWDARIEIAPMVTVRVRDSYVDGEARMLGRILGLVTVVDASDDPALGRGALARYLAESVWAPTRLGEGPGLAWTGIDDTSARATLVDGPTTVSLVFTFDELGDPIGVEGVRPREVDGRYVETPWIGRFADHRPVHGFRIPFYGEVAWIVDNVEVPYFRGRIVDIDFRVR